MGATPMLAGTVLSGASSIYGGLRQNAADRASAAQMQGQGESAVAAGEQGMASELKRGAYVVSNARARTAASGMTTTGTSAIANEGQIAGQARYQALEALYRGQSEQSLDTARANALRDEGRAAEVAGWAGGISSVLKGGASFYGKYGGTFNPEESGYASGAYADQALADAGFG